MADIPSADHLLCLIVATSGLVLVANTLKEVFMSSMPRSLLLLLIICV